MKLINSNITRLVNSCNKSFQLQGLDVKMHLLKCEDNGENALFILKTENKTFGKVIVYNDGRLIVDNDDLNIHFDVKLERQIEITQFIALAAIYKLLTGQSLEVIITQSISGWTNAKVIRRHDGKYVCIHTSVIKQIMKYAPYKAPLHIKNAKLSSNGSIIVDKKNYPTTDFVIGPEIMWKFR